MIIHTKTKRDFKALLKKLHKKGFKWESEDSLLKKEFIDNYWKDHKSKIYIAIRKAITYGNIDEEDMILELGETEIIKYDEKTIDKLLMINNLGREE